MNNKVIVAKDLLKIFVNENKISKFNILKELKGKDFENTTLFHPLSEYGYDHDVPMLEANFVTTEQGYRICSIAPGHGSDDFDLGLINNLQVIETVSDDGYLKNNLPLFGGLHVLRDNETIADIMIEKNH